jgi:regulator of RNase E activity RraA
MVKGVAGVIVDGAVRDVDESRELGLPVFGRAGVQVTARTRIIEESCNEPIEMCGVWVKPGDLVIADSSGVVFISADHEDEVVTSAEDIAAREALMTKDVLSGKPISEVMGANYETMLERK